jgi:hypothetical protein
MTNHRLVYRLAEKDIMANISKLILGAAIAAASIATPALSAQRGKPVSVYQNGYVTRSSQRSGIYNLAPLPPANDPGARPYHYDPINAPNGP